MPQRKKPWYRWIPGLRELVETRIKTEELLEEVRLLRSAQVIGLLDFAAGSHPRYGDPKRLHAYARQVCSQNGEDGMLDEIFRRIGTTDRLFAEIGAGNGRENNTAYFLSRGWSGYWIDGDARLARNVARRKDLRPRQLQFRVAMVDKENIGQVFADLQIPPEIDLLSIDIDQNTYYLWAGLQNYRPRVVVVEYNGIFPADVNWKVQYDPSRGWDGTSNFGASLKAFELLGNERGYCLVGCDITGLNAFFVRKDLVGDHFCAPFTAENHYEPTRYGLIIRRGHKAGQLDTPS